MVGNTKSVWQAIINNNAVLTGEDKYCSEIKYDFEEIKKEN